MKDSDTPIRRNKTSNTKPVPDAKSHIKAKLTDGPNIELVPVDRVDTLAPRLRKSVGSIQTLSQSISAIGLLHPITVRREAGRFVLLAGERRLQVFKVLGIKSIPARVLTYPPSDLDTEGSES